LVVLIALLWLFRETAQAMVAIWSRSETFAHAFLVPPIALWLIWRKRAQIARTPIAPSPLWLVPLLGSCLAWLLGQLVAVNAVTQMALVAMIICSVPAVMGSRVARVVAFPLLFLFFAVPVGEFLIEPMMEGTADFTVAALRLSGIPVYREGLQFVIPSGNWSVVAACSGVRYLIASTMVGTLFAYLNFHSMRRRLAFVAFAVAVPIVANWLRAYMIVMIGHLSSNQLAAGADHLIYGWLFFGVVVLLMFMVGSRFVDALPAAEPTPTPAAAGSAAARRGGWLAAGALLALLMSMQLLYEHLARSRPGGPGLLNLPAQMPRWEGLVEPITQWSPAYRHAATAATAQYRAIDGRPDDVVGVWAAIYRDQAPGRKMITSGNVLVDETSRAWLPMAQTSEQVKVGNLTVDLRSATLRSPADPKVRPTQRLLVWRVYQVGSRHVAGDARAMIQLGLQRLVGQGDDSAVLIFYTPTSDDGRGRERLRGFVQQSLPELAARIEVAMTQSLASADNAASTTDAAGTASGSAVPRN
jgi:exosortase A